MARRKPINPFYFLLVVIGVVFVATAGAYCVLLVRTTQPMRNAAPQAQDGESGGLIQVMKDRGEQILLVELGLLAAATFGAIATDSYWIRRFEKPSARSAEPEQDQSGPQQSDGPSSQQETMS